MKVKRPAFLIAILFCALNGLFAQRTDTIIIHFDFDRSDIRPEAAATLDSFLSAANTAAIQQIELYGHCDYVGDHGYNDALSLRRVAQAKAYLLQKGLGENVFQKNDGFGKRRPLNDNATSLERLQNRRVEVVVHWRATDVPVTQPPAEEKKPQVSLTELIKDTATKAGSNIILRNLQFQPGRHFLLPQSMPTLDTLYQVLTANPTLEIEIQGHVCCTPTNTDGLDIDLSTYDLSIQRARTIYDDLVRRGIAAKRLGYRGFGGSRKLYPFERDDFERQENRRVELRIIKR
jgi:outer membrane protein OmpA-like peptidoglycan-associated protein